MTDIFNIQLVFSQIPQLLVYLPMTLLITIFSLVIGVSLGLVIALIRIKKIFILSHLTVGLVSFVRGTPLLIQLYLSFYGIPILFRYLNYYYDLNYNINNLSPLLFVLFAFSINEAAYASESIRAAIQAIDEKQIEAAQSLGMTKWQILWRITIPNAFFIALPNLGNTVINLLKGTSLAFVCSVIEMTAQGKIIAGSSYRYFEVYVSLALIYWAITIVIERVISWLEHHFAIPENTITK